MKPVLDKNIERMRILVENMQDKEISTKEASDLVGLSLTSFGSLLDTFSENYPVYEYRKGNKIILGLLKK